VGLAATLAAVAALVVTGSAAAPSGAVLADVGGVRSTIATVAPVPQLFAGGLSAGVDYSLGWDADGVLHASGANTHNQLGTGATESTLRPERVALPDGQRVVDAAAGITVTIALTADGGVWTWGHPSVGSNGGEPQRVPSFDALDDPVVGVDAGGYFYLAWTRSGALYSWGTADSRLGRPATDSHDPPARVTAQGLDGRAVSSASAGRFQAAAVADGGVVAWGAGFGDHAGVALTGLPAVGAAEVSAGSGVLVVRSADGTVALARSAAAEPVPGLAGVAGAVTSVPTSRPSAFFAWDDGGSLWAWGSDTGGHLGLGAPDTDHPAPVPVPLPDGVRVTHVAAGRSHALHGTAGGGWAAAGDNGSGQLGDGTTTSTDLVAAVPPADRWP
jgi:alpha-tubulin suppressor-like RCC1 family protein